MPSDKAYRVPTAFLLFFLLANLLGIYIAVMMLRSRMKASWPW